MEQPHWNIFEWDDPEKKRTAAMSAARMMFYVLDGRTNRGRRLRLIFQDKGHGIVRVFTGWELNKKR